MVGVRGILHCLGPASGSGTRPLARAFSASLYPPFPAAADLCFVLVWDIQPQRASCPFLRARAVLLVSSPEAEHLCSWPSANRTCHLSPRGRKVFLLLIPRVFAWALATGAILSLPYHQLKGFCLELSEGSREKHSFLPGPQEHPAHTCATCGGSLQSLAYGRELENEGTLPLCLGLLVDRPILSLWKCDLSPRRDRSLLKFSSGGRLAMQLSDRLRKGMVV